MVLLKQCCCGCTLQKGAQIIGWLEIVFNTLQIISIAISATVTTSVNNGVGSGTPASSENQVVAENSQNPEKISIIILFVGIKVLSLICGIFLILGAARLNKRYLIPYLVSQAIGLVLTGIIIIVQLFSIAGGNSLIFSSALAYGKLIKNVANKYEVVIIFFLFFSLYSLDNLFLFGRWVILPRDY